MRIAGAVNEQFRAMNPRAVTLRCSRAFFILLILLAWVGLSNVARAATKPTISSFTASPSSITKGQSSTLSWVTSGATSISIIPGTFTSTAAS